MSATVLKSLQPFLPRKFIYADVGARGGLGHPWSTLSDIVEAVYFEADPMEQRALQQAGTGRVLPYALGNECTTAPFFLAAARRTSSFLAPNMPFVSQYPNPERFVAEEICHLATVTLDSLLDSNELTDIDFIKLDTQGTELNILQGGERILQRCILGLQVEVEFESLYEKQPLFHHVDAYVREKLHMALFDLPIVRWRYTEGAELMQTPGHPIFADALYFLPPDALVLRCQAFDKPYAYNKCLMALVMALAFGHVDYTLRLLGLAEKAHILPASLLQAIAPCFNAIKQG